jgi:hypothetical protein
VVASSSGGGQNQPKSSSRKTWLKAAELLVKSGAYWEANWRSPHGCTQLHLLLAAFPPSREDSAIYRALLKSALDAGVNPAHEDQKGRNALFVLSEQMAVTPSDQVPDAPRLIHILIEASSVMTPQQQQYGIGGSDRTGRTIFDIHETVPHSCLHACKSLLVQATSKAAAVSAASGYRGLPPSLSVSHSSTALIGAGSGIGGVGGGVAGYDWEKERTASKVSSAMIAQMTAHGNSRATSPRASQAMNLPSYPASQQQHQHQHQQHQHHRAGGGNPPRPPSSYFDGDDDDSDDGGLATGLSHHRRRPSSSSAVSSNNGGGGLHMQLPGSQSHSRRPSASSATGLTPRW